MAKPHRSLPTLTEQDIARFHSKYKIGQPEGCWEWQYCLFDDGYGAFTQRDQSSRRKRTIRAHRVAYLLHYGTDPAEMKVCHTCDNPPCVNPAHLFLGTSQDNMTDKIRKGRQKCGEQVASHKLSESDVRELRQMRANGLIRTEADKMALANRFGVSMALIEKVIYHQAWPHI